MWKGQNALQKADKGSKKVFQQQKKNKKGAMCSDKIPEAPVCAVWPSLLSTCVNAMLDKFLFEFPH